MSTSPRSRHGETGPARPGGVGSLLRLVIGVVFVATTAFVITLAAGATAGSVPFAPLLAGLGLLAFFLVVYAFAPGPL